MVLRFSEFLNEEESLSPIINHFFDVSSKPAELSDTTVYKFVPKSDQKRKLQIPDVVYNYSTVKGNVWLKKAENYTTQELRSNSFAFNKGDKTKMAIPHNLKAAANYILNHFYFKGKRAKYLTDEEFEELFRNKRGEFLGNELNLS